MSISPSNSRDGTTVPRGNRMLVAGFFRFCRRAHQLHGIVVPLLREGDPGVDCLDLEICLTGPVTYLGRCTLPPSNVRRRSASLRAAVTSSAAGRA